MGQTSWTTFCLVWSSTPTTWRSWWRREHRRTMKRNARLRPCSTRYCHSKYAAVILHQILHNCEVLLISLCVCVSVQWRNSSNEVRRFRPKPLTPSPFTSVTSSVSPHSQLRARHYRSVELSRTQLFVILLSQVFIDKSHEYFCGIFPLWTPKWLAIDTLHHQSWAIY